MTATAVMSLTAEPPQLAAAVNRNASALPLILESRVFSVNLLTYPERVVAERFSGFGGVVGEDRFTGTAWSTLETGAPVLDGVSTAFDCRVVQTLEVDTHLLVIGAVEAVRMQKDAPQLLYLDGGWASLVRATQEQVQAYRTAVDKAAALLRTELERETEPARQLAAFAHGFIDYNLEHRAMIQEVLALEPYMDEATRTEINAAKRDFDSTLRGLLRRGVEAGRFSLIDEALTACSISGIVNWASRWYREGAGLSRQEVARRLVVLIERLVSPSIGEVGPGEDQSCG